MREEGGYFLKYGMPPQYIVSVHILSPPKRYRYPAIDLATSRTSAPTRDTCEQKYLHFSTIEKGDDRGGEFPFLPGGGGGAAVLSAQKGRGCYSPHAKTHLIGLIAFEYTAFYNYTCVSGCRQNASAGAAYVLREVVPLALDPDCRVLSEVDDSRSFDVGDVSREI